MGKNFLYFLYLFLFFMKSIMCSLWQNVKIKNITELVTDLVEQPFHCAGQCILHISLGLLGHLWLELLLLFCTTGPSWFLGLWVVPLKRSVGVWEPLPMTDRPIILWENYTHTYLHMYCIYVLTYSTWTYTCINKYIYERTSYITYQAHAHCICFTSFCTRFSFSIVSLFLIITLL